MQKIWIIEFFLENRLHWQFEVRFLVLTVYTCVYTFRPPLIWISRSHNAVLDPIIGIFDKFTRRAKPIRITSVGISGVLLYCSITSETNVPIVAKILFSELLHNRKHDSRRRGIVRRPKIYIKSKGHFLYVRNVIFCVDPAHISMNLKSIETQQTGRNLREIIFASVTFGGVRVVFNHYVANSNVGTHLHLVPRLRISGAIPPRL